MLAPFYQLHFKIQRIIFFKGPYPGPGISILIWALVLLSSSLPSWAFLIHFFNNAGLHCTKVGTVYHDYLSSHLGAALWGLLRGKSNMELSEI